ncbi:hypothetical protein HYC85_028249 [Camellia sinensis]|uniref:Uncharacterized protein n=1 Tax=Camellia sinensis TaxID=4442 RepID=A0A7J7FWP4_CAMSI|nr:hypothetical protein HYC85_028249 [Camellia sinensis]
MGKQIRGLQTMKHGYFEKHVVLVSAKAISSASIVELAIMDMGHLEETEVEKHIAFPSLEMGSLEPEGLVEIADILVELLHLKHLLGFMEEAEELKSKGVDGILCLSGLSERESNPIQ